MEAGAECAASDEQEMGSGATLKPQSLLVGLVRAQPAVLRSDRRRVDQARYITEHDRNFEGYRDTGGIQNPSGCVERSAKSNRPISGPRHGPRHHSHFPAGALWGIHTILLI